MNPVLGSLLCREKPYVCNKTCIWKSSKAPSQKLPKFLVTVE